MAAIAAPGKNTVLARPLSGPLATGASRIAPTIRPATIDLPLPKETPGNVPPPLAAEAPGNFPPPPAGEGRVGASRSTHVIANRQLANTIVLNRSPTGSNSAG